MTDHEIVKATADAEYDIVWEFGEPEVGHTTNRRNTRWHCSCGDTFGSSKEAAEHIESAGTEK